MNAIIALFSNYRWAITLIILNVVIHYSAPIFPELTEDGETREALRSVIEFALMMLVGLMLRLPRSVVEDGNIKSAWQLLLDSITNRHDSK